MLRWLGLAAFVLGLACAGINPQSTAVGVIGLLLIIAGIGCYIALGVLAYQYRQQHDSTGIANGSDASRDRDTPR